MDKKCHPLLFGNTTSRTTHTFFTRSLCTSPLSSFSTMNPYETEPEHIPINDLYADIPLYGRYRSKPGDFSVQLEHVGCLSSTSLHYWESVISLCDETTRIYPADEGGRDVFALGNIIVKSSHLHDEREMVDYSFE